MFFKKAQGEGQAGQESSLGKDLDHEHRRHCMGHQHGDPDSKNVTASLFPALDEGHGQQDAQDRGNHRRPDGDLKAHQHRA